MKRLKQELREWLESPNPYPRGRDSEVFEGCRTYIRFLLDAHGSGWISVEEDLPEALRPVLACYEYGGCFILYMVRGDYWNHQDGDTALSGVTHWQPLPQPPELEGGTDATD